MQAGAEKCLHIRGYPLPALGPRQAWAELAWWWERYFPQYSDIGISISETSQSPANSSSDYTRDQTELRSAKASPERKSCPAETGVKEMVII